jgi:hypothetical protein
MRAALSEKIWREVAKSPSGSDAQGGKTNRSQAGFHQTGILHANTDAF